MIDRIRLSISVIGYSGSENTPKFSCGEIHQIVIAATTETNSFNIDITDDDGDIIYSQERIIGYFEESGITIPVQGIYTISISNASSDENIIVKLLVYS